jgi:hypothetical protein
VAYVATRMSELALEVEEYYVSEAEVVRSMRGPSGAVKSYVNAPPRRLPRPHKAKQRDCKCNYSLEESVH